MTDSPATAQLHAAKGRVKGYRFGVRWIAENDEPDGVDEDEVSGYISTLLLADLFGKPPAKVAADIVRLRKLEGIGE